MHIFKGLTQCEALKRILIFNLLTNFQFQISLIKRWKNSPEIVFFDQNLLYFSRKFGTRGKSLVTPGILHFTTFSESILEYPSPIRVSS